MRQLVFTVRLKRAIGPATQAGLFGLFLLVSGSTQAFIVDLQFVDETLVANRAVEIEAEFWGCGPPFPNVDGIEHEVRRDGSVIDLYYSTQTSPCGVPPPGPVVTYRLGLLAEGDYTLRYARVENTEPFPLSMEGLDPTLVPFSVGGPVVSPIPATSLWSMVTLMLLLAWLAAYRIRSQV